MICENKKPIAFVINNLSRGGAENFVTLLANGLINEYDVHIITFYKGRSDYKFNENVFFFNLELEKSLFSFLVSPFRLKNYLKNNNIGIVNVFLYKSIFYTTLTKLLFKFKFTLIIHERTFSENFFKSSFFKSLIGKIFIKFFYNKSDFIIANSELSRYSLINYYGILNDVFVLYNPVKEPFVKVNRILSSTFKMVNVGNHYVYKNQELLIKAASNLSFFDWELSFIGLGSETNNLKKLVKELGLCDKVYFLGSVDSYSFYNDFSIFVSTSNLEGFPNVLIEAMAHGLPIVSTDCKSGPREIIAPSTDFNYSLHGDSIFELAEFGILIPVGSENSLVKAIEHLFYSRDSLVLYQSKSLARSSDFDLGSRIESFISLLNKKI